MNLRQAVPLFFGKVGGDRERAKLIVSLFESSASIVQAEGQARRVIIIIDDSIR